MTVHYADDAITLHHGGALDVARTLPDESVGCIVTSPPYYGLRDYDDPEQWGLEATPTEYVDKLQALFTELFRVLAVDGTLWLNLGDSYSSSGGHTEAGETSALQGRSVLGAQNRSRGGNTGDRPLKNLLGMPWRVAFALQDAGWVLRNAIVWEKPNAMPSSVTDRVSNRYEHVFMLTRSPQYWFDLDAIREPLLHPGAADGSRTFGGANKGQHGGVDSTSRTRGGNTYTARDDGRGRNPGDVWSIATVPFAGPHYATMPPDLARRCVAAGARPDSTVLDPFSGTGTTGMVAGQLGHRYVGIDVSLTALDLSLRTRLAAGTLI